MLRASELELTNPEDIRLELVQVLMAIERLDEAKALSASDANSDKFSEKWLDYLEKEEHRRAVVYDTLSTRLLQQVERLPFLVTSEKCKISSS